MQETTNYKLKKLELTDSPADITVLNGNWDTIDAELKEHEGSLSSQAQSIAEINEELDTKYDKAGGTISGAVTVSKGGITVTGNSTFNNNVTVKGTTLHENPIRSNEENYLQISVPVTRGTKPSSTLYSNWSVYDQNGYGTQNRLAHIGYKVTNASVSSLSLYVNKYVAGGQEIPVGLSAGWAGEEPQIMLTHTPPADSDDKSVATTEWVKALKATAGEYGLVKLADETALLNEADDTALSVSGAYRLNDFRRKSTTYDLGDTVNCAFNSEFFLECTQAGTTKNGSLDTRNVTFGQVITDGTCKWTVRRHLKGINGELPDENGNIEIDVDTGNLAKLDANNIFTSKTQALAHPITKGSTGTASNRSIRFIDNQGGTDYAANGFGTILNKVYSNGDVETGMYAHKNDPSQNINAYMGVIYPIDGEPYARAPTPADTANGNEIITAKWANNNLVNLTGAQTVKGNKTFSGTVTLNGTTTVSKTPTANTHVANKKYVDDHVFSGNYNDLTNKPNLSSYATQSWVTSQLDGLKGKTMGLPDYSTGVVITSFPFTPSRPCFLMGARAIGRSHATRLALAIKGVQLEGTFIVSCDTYNFDSVGVIPTTEGRNVAHAYPLTAALTPDCTISLSGDSGVIYIVYPK